MSAGGAGVARVAWWLAAGGREQRTRVLVTATGIALGVTLLLLAAVLWPAIRGHEARAAWTTTAAHNVRPAQDESATDPLLWRLRVDSYRGREIVRLDVAPLGPRAPLPPGLSQLPGPGQLAVSPGLRRLLAQVPAGQLADRFPGRPVAAVGDAALKYPGQLVVVVGYRPAELRGQPAVEEVRSIETQPRTVSLTRFGRVIVGIAVAALLVPILVLVATATRLSATRRAQRLAAVRLLGATSGQIGLAGAAEAALAAVVGTAIGFGGFWAARPLAAHWGIDGYPFFPADLRLGWTAVLPVALGVPVLCVAAGLLALRRVQINPLGVSRRAPADRPTWRRLVLLAAGLATLAVALPVVAAGSGTRLLWLLGVAITLMIVGIVAAGPWLTMGIGRLLVRLARRPAGLLAGHRLATDPTAGFRSIAGLVVVVFLVTMVSMASRTAEEPPDAGGGVRLPAGAVGTEFLFQGTVPLPPERSAALVGHLHTVPGVRGVLDLRWAGTGQPAPGADAVPVVTGCAELRASGLGSCADPAATVGLDGLRLANGYAQGIGRPAINTPLARLPVLALLVTTDGRPGSMETVRTAIEAAVPQAAWLPWTTDETKAHSDREGAEIRRISTAVLLATLLIAGFSLAIAITSGLLDRRRPFALLRLAGTSTGQLRRVLLTETALPLLTGTAVSVAVGVAVITDVTHATHVPWRPPPATFWWALGGGVAVAVGVVLLTTIPLLGRLTAPETTRFE